MFLPLFWHALTRGDRLHHFFFFKSRLFYLLEKTSVGEVVMLILITYIKHVLKTAVKSFRRWTETCPSVSVSRPVGERRRLGRAQARVQRITSTQCFTTKYNPTTRNIMQFLSLVIFACSQASVWPRARSFRRLKVEYRTLRFCFSSCIFVHRRNLHKQICIDFGLNWP